MPIRCIEPDKGGSIEGTIGTLNQVLDLTVPSKMLPGRAAPT